MKSKRDDHKYISSKITKAKIKQQNIAEKENAPKKKPAHMLMMIYK